MSASAGAMRTMNAHSSGELRLWGTSACTALLAHLIAGTLLFLHWEWHAPLPVGSSGTLSGTVAVDLAAMPAARAPAVPAAGATPGPSVPQLSPLPQMAQITSEFPAADLAQSRQAAANLAPALPSADSAALAAVTTLGEANAPSAPNWLAQVRAQLDRYKEYPASARRRHQQDTVSLHFTIDRAGQVTSSRIDSPHHYKALEQAVRRMLQRAAPFAAPPANLPVDALVIDQEVDFKIITPTSPPLSSLCARPAEPGPVPAGSTATLQQMRAYRDHLNQYQAATRSYLDCLTLASSSGSPPEGSAAIARFDVLARAFNAQAQVFTSAAAARALQAQQQAAQAHAARLAQVRAAVARAYGACTAPPPPDQSRPLGALSSDALPAYRKRLVAYGSAVRAYVACIDQARRAVLAQSGDGLTGAERIGFEVDAARIGNAAVKPLNQLVAAFNAKLQGLQKQAVTAREQMLAQALVRRTVVFPDSTWGLPSPLPADECIRITRSGQSYVAQLCRSSYAMSNPGAASADAAMANATQAETIAASHGVAGDGPGQAILGIAAAPSAASAQASANQPKLISYAINQLQIVGGRVSLTISWRSSGSKEESAIHFELALSADARNLRGRCSSELRHWGCQLSRHP